MDYERLLSAARKGEAWSGPALVTALMPMLIRYAQDIGSDLSLADQEVVVEMAVLKAVDRLERFDPALGSFPAWVRGFLRYEVANVRRARGPGPVALMGEIPAAILDAPNPDASLPDEEHDLTWPLFQLSVVDQVIIKLRDFEGLTYAQAAERIGGGVTEGACRVRHHRALARLREKLIDDPNFRFLIGAADNE